MMPPRNECLHRVRQPSYPVALNRLVADDFCCYVIPLFDGSAEREGVTVQIGATVSHWIGRRLPFQDPGNTFLLIGMAAGFAAAGFADALHRLRRSLPVQHG